MLKTHDGQESHFKSLKIKEGGEVDFRGDEKGKIIGIGDIGNTSSNSIENVLLVRGLKHNLLSISQLCDKGYKVILKITIVLFLIKSQMKSNFLEKDTKTYI